MAQTLTQQLTSAILKLHNDPADAETAELVQKLAAEVGPAWVQAKKPAALSVTRAALVNAWIIQAGTDPVLAASDGPVAAAALSALAATLDGPPPSWVEIWLSDGPLPPLADVAAAIASLAKQGVDAVTPSFGAGVWIVGGLAVAYLLTRKRR